MTDDKTKSNNNTDTNSNLNNDGHIMVIYALLCNGHICITSDDSDK